MTTILKLAASLRPDVWQATCQIGTLEANSYSVALQLGSISTQAILIKLRIKAIPNPNNIGADCELTLTSTLPKRLTIG